MSKVKKFQIVIVGGGAAGLAVASSLLKRDRSLHIAVIDAADTHYYQPGWTMVGGGIFSAEQTRRKMESLIPQGVHWVRQAVVSFDAKDNSLELDDGTLVGYDVLVVCPGLTLDWAAVDGLQEALGHNGVTSNYRYDLAPYTWELVQKLRGGPAIFTQPAMPIKCAGAPQKAMYLAADYWRKAGVLNAIDISFCNAGGVLFGVPEYVPALMQYIEKYGVHLNFGENLVSVDGKRKTATLRKISADGAAAIVERNFDMLHVVPPQRAPNFIKNSELGDANGWLDVDPATLRHKSVGNIFGLGDVVNTTNAKTAAAARKQAPVVAHNVLNMLSGKPLNAAYDGYGSCPLTVERGKIVLAEFTYGGKVKPSFPGWFIDGTKPSRLAWQLKKTLLPEIYWSAMLKGRELMASPTLKN